ncbi:HpsJ family protein [Synechococcus sp. ATX 2A4]|uniref:HpsJ family protein n=1 Tax=Synechococcus sp. ATX 2A4 TaxID=2823727 RepID=UPI0020CDA52A|nr:HpsJ family protein [Synechococcus sp. ATX 2A4]MCP9884686.1 HpsJ family protein [Synechococcus sp. ATX 2A4]
MALVPAWVCSTRRPFHDSRREPDVNPARPSLSTLTKPFSEPGSQPVPVSAVLNGAATCLFIVFAITALTLFLPLDPTNPSWQLRLIGGVINGAPLALLGFVLLHGAAHLDPQQSRYGVRLATARQRALLAAIGFVVLVPLQCVAIWTLLSRDENQLEQRRATTEATFVTLREAVQRAGTPEALKLQMRALRGPTISEEQLKLPIATLREQTMRALFRAEAVMNQQLSGLDQKAIMELVQSGIRIGVSSLAYAFAFALGAVMGQPLILRRIRKGLQWSSRRILRGL